MLSILVGAEEIADAQTALEQTMRSRLSEIDHRNIGYPGGIDYDAEICTDGSYWYHHRFHSPQNGGISRHLNWFGTVRLGTLHITVEINVVPRGPDNRIQGFFARDTLSGDLYLMHTGGLRGGIPGLNADAFPAWLSDPAAEAYYPDGTLRRGFIVLPITPNSTTRPLVRYMQKVAEFRQAIEAGQIHPDNPDYQNTRDAYQDYYSEPQGSRSGYIPTQIDPFSYHGSVVDELHEQRAKQDLSGLKVVKNIYIDMGVVDQSGSLVELYEVKTNTHRSNVYTAIGQLMVHAPDNCRKILVIPQDKELATDLLSTLHRLQIETLTFSMNNDEIIVQL